MSLFHLFFFYKSLHMAHHGCLIGQKISNEKNMQSLLKRLMGIPRMCVPSWAISHKMNIFFNQLCFPHIILGAFLQHVPSGRVSAIWKLITVVLLLQSHQTSTSDSSGFLIFVYNTNGIIIIVINVIKHYQATVYEWLPNWKYNNDYSTINFTTEILEDITISLIISMMINSFIKSGCELIYAFEKIICRRD